MRRRLALADEAPSLQPVRGRAAVAACVDRWEPFSVPSCRGAAHAVAFRVQLQERAEAAQGQAAERTRARQANAARLNLRVERAARARQAWAEPDRGASARACERPPWARMNERRHRHQQVAPRVSLAAYAAETQAAKAAAEAKRALIHPGRWRWGKAELLDIQELRDRCAVKGLNTLGSKSELDARLYFATAPQA